MDATRRRGLATGVIVDSGGGVNRLLLVPGEWNAMLPREGGRNNCIKVPPKVNQHKSTHADPAEMSLAGGRRGSTGASRGGIAEANAAGDLGGRGG